MSRDPARPGEFEIIDRWLKPLAAAPGAFRLADDAALLTPVAGEELVLTADMVAEGVHFFTEDAAGSVARKVLAVNLSDLAAKGAVPVGYLLCLALPEDFKVEWLDAFVAGLRAEQERHGIGLLGGDTIRSGGGVTVSITAIGQLPAGSMVRRSGAGAGDVVFVSGTIGDAALGLALRQGRLAVDVAGEGADHLLDRYLHPRPRLNLAATLRAAATAALDVSDGLVGDLAHLCRASGVGARIEADLVPLSEVARRVVRARPEMLETVLTGGDDYEILATVPEGAADQFEEDAKVAGGVVTRIGRLTEGEAKPTVIGADGKELSFRRASHVQF